MTLATPSLSVLSHKLGCGGLSLLPIWSSQNNLCLEAFDFLKPPLQERQILLSLLLPHIALHLLDLSHFDSAHTFLFFPPRGNPILSHPLFDRLSFTLPSFLPHYFLYPAVLPDTQGLRSFVLRSDD
ncbi:uncharacterized protein ARMOST_17824 [Armillaria ostoyae]|uniref:Uncharacterized protein n=1 Tax=Armillaria ostoyae TaxID=47428 RepID=A0A284S023_ARMOS|nr:uncharacterized protein ARMOST_17824 [Armillaria ostoyae]